MKTRWIYSRPTDGPGNWFEADGFVAINGGREFETLVGGHVVRKLPGHVEAGNHVLLKTLTCQGRELEIVPIKRVEREVNTPVC